MQAMHMVEGGGGACVKTKEIRMIGRAVGSEQVNKRLDGGKRMLR